ncbi:MAG: hypothetical protein AAFU41_19965 [Pseudomonadota bacterium]
MHSATCQELVGNGKTGRETIEVAMRLIFLLFALLASPLRADVGAIAETARASFAQMPMVREVDQIAGNCGADDTVNPVAAYCTTSNEILLARDSADSPEATYVVAHLFGHAVQVRHGVADFALSQIRARRSEEQMLRGLVERQVDCIAGFLLQRAGVPQPDLTTWYDVDPLEGPHWGRNPLARGPVVNVPVAERNAWLAIGYGGDLSACAPGEFGSDLLVAALRS